MIFLDHKDLKLLAEAILYEQNQQWDRLEPDEVWHYFSDDLAGNFKNIGRGTASSVIASEIFSKLTYGENPEKMQLSNFPLEYVVFPFNKEHTPETIGSLLSFWSQEFKKLFPQWPFDEKTNFLEFKNIYNQLFNTKQQFKKVLEHSEVRDNPALFIWGNFSGVFPTVRALNKFNLWANDEWLPNLANFKIYIDVRRDGMTGNEQIIFRLGNKPGFVNFKGLTRAEFSFNRPNIISFVSKESRGDPDARDLPLFKIFTNPALKNFEITSFKVIDEINSIINDFRKLALIKDKGE
jgi:hypothetical protein